MHLKVKNADKIKIPWVGAVVIAVTWFCASIWLAVTWALNWSEIAGRNSNII